MAKKDQKKSDVKSEGQTQAQAAQSALQTAASDEQTLRETPDENLSEESASRTQIRKGPASDKETLLMQFPKDGRIQVLSEIAEKDDDTVSFIMTEPSLKNVAAFYEILNCRELAAKMMQYNKQFKDWKTETPRYYKVPQTQVPQLTMALTALKQDPQNVEAQAIQRKYATTSFSLEKIIFDQPRLPIHLLSEAGFDVVEMREAGAFKQMENGQFSKRLFARKENVNGMKIEGMYAIRAIHDEYGDISFEAMTPQNLDALKNDPLLSQLDEKTRMEVLGGKTLPYPVRHEGQLCFAGINRTLNRMMYVPCSDYPAPSSIYGVNVDQAQRQALGRGERVLFRDCSSKDDDPDNHYEGYGQFDMNKMEYMIADKYYERPHLPKSILEQLNAQQLETVFEKNGYINGADLRKQNGEPLLYMIGINPVTNNIQYVSYPRYEQAVAEAQKKGVSVKDILNKADRQQSVEHVPDIAANKKRKGQSM
ncbi:MAG: hypothetical protein ACLU6R_04920 [Alistipes onderdonkii]